MRSYVDDESVIGMIEMDVEGLLLTEAEIEAGECDGKPGQEMSTQQRRHDVAGLSAAAMLRAEIPGVPRLMWGRMLQGDPEIYGAADADEMALKFTAKQAKRYRVQEPRARGIRDVHMCACFCLADSLLRPSAIKAFKRWKCSRLDRSGRYGRLVRQLVNLQAFARGEPIPYPN